MDIQTNPAIIFLRVTDTNTKIRRIVRTIQQHFLSGDSLIIFVPNQQAAEYIDSLLWRVPSDSFLPHTVANESCRDRVVITQGNSNINGAKVALNLTPKPCADHGTFEKIYELWDQTDGKKVQQSKDKMQEYKNQGLLKDPFTG